MSDQLTPETPPAPERTPVTPDGKSTGAVPGWERAALERIALAAIHEQRASHRWKIFFRFAFLLVLAIIAWRIFDVNGTVTPPGSSARHSALVTLDGEIMAGGQASADNIDTALESAFEDNGTVGVILEINSPGGSPVQAGMMYNEIRRLRAKYPRKPLYVVVDDLCASGGYYVAAAADKIYVDKASIVGSIGVLMEGFGFNSLMDKLGIERRLHISGENKALFDPFSPESDKAKQYAQTMLDQIHEQFIDAVKQGRGKRLKDDPDLFSGLFWSGQKSVELGLADGFGDTGYVAREVLKAPDVVDYTVKENFADRVAHRFGASLGAAAVKTLISGGVRLQ